MTQARIETAVKAGEIMGKAVIIALALGVAGLIGFAVFVILL